MSVITKVQPLKDEERRTLEKWLKFYDRWLWGNRISTREAARLAKSDTGIEAITSRRLAIMAGKKCESFCVNKTGESRKAMLNSRQWYRAMSWIEEHKPEVIEAGSVVAASTLAHWKCGARISASAFGEALSARGITLPWKNERPAWVKAEAA
jgi:hypothetical protein